MHTLPLATPATPAPNSGARGDTPVAAPIDPRFSFQAAFDDSLLAVEAEMEAPDEDVLTPQDDAPAGRHDLSKQGRSVVIEGDANDQSGAEIKVDGTDPRDPRVGRQHLETSARHKTSISPHTSTVELPNQRSQNASEPARGMPSSSSGQPAPFSARHATVAANSITPQAAEPTASTPMKRPDQIEAAEKTNISLPSVKSIPGAEKGVPVQQPKTPSSPLVPLRVSPLQDNTAGQTTAHRNPREPTVTPTQSPSDTPVTHRPISPRGLVGASPPPPTSRDTGTSGPALTDTRNVVPDYRNIEPPAPVQQARATTAAIDPPMRSTPRQNLRADAPLPTAAPIAPAQQTSAPSAVVPTQWTAAQPPAKIGADTWEGRQTETPFSVVRAEATAQQAQTPLPHRAELPAHVARQLAEVVAQQPNRPIEITLSPEELGRVRLTVKVSETGVAVNLLAERPETLDLMRRHIDQLGMDFQALGYDDIAFSFSGNGADPEQDKASQNESNTEFVPSDTADDTTRIELRSVATSGLDLRL